MNNIWSRICVVMIRSSFSPLTDIPHIEIDSSELFGRNAAIEI